MAVLIAAGCVTGPAKPKLDRSLADRLAQSQEQFSRLEGLPKIDMHEHYVKGANLNAYLEVMREFHIEKVFFFPTGARPDNRGYKENMAELLAVAHDYPEIVPFATVDEADPEAPEILDDAVRKGAKGLKLLGGHPNLYDEPLDSPKWMALLERARKYKLPVVMHISPVKIPKQAKEFENLVRAFPDVTIVAAHYGRYAPDFTEAARLLDTYPNLYMDVSMGGGLARYQRELPRYAGRYRDFILKYQDRLLWGCDLILHAKKTAAFVRERMKIDMLLLGQPVYVDRRNKPHSARIHTGLALPEPVLRKIFYDNPKRILLK